MKTRKPSLQGTTHKSLWFYHHNCTQATNICLHVALLVNTSMSRKTKNIQYYSGFRDRWLPFMYALHGNMKHQYTMQLVSHVPLFFSCSTIVMSNVFAIIRWHGWVLLASFPGPSCPAFRCLQSFAHGESLGTRLEFCDYCTVVAAHMIESGI